MDNKNQLNLSGLQDAISKGYLKMDSTTSAPSTSGQFDFTKNVAGAVLQKAKTFLTEDLAKNAERRNKLTLAQLAKEDIGKVGDSFKFMMEAAKQTVQSPFRFLFQSALSGQEAISGRRFSYDLNDNPVLKALVGADKLESFQEKTGRQSQFIASAGGSGLEQKIFPVAGIVGGAALDFTGFGGNSKRALKLAIPELTEDLIKNTDPKVITGLLTAKGMIKKDAEIAAEAFAKARNRQEVQLVADSIFEPPQKFNPNFDTTKYVQESVARREAARLAEDPTLKQKALSLYDEAKRKLVDATAPLTDFPKRALRSSLDEAGASRAVRREAIEKLDISIDDVISKALRYDGPAS